MSPDEEDRRRKLAVIATALGEEVASLRQAEIKYSEALEDLTAEVRKKNFRTTIKIRVLVVLVIFCLIFASLATYSYYRLRIVVNDAFCPLMAVFIGSYDPDSRPAGPGRQAYNSAFAQMRTIYGPVLECTTPIAPPRMDSK